MCDGLGQNERPLDRSLVSHSERCTLEMLATIFVFVLFCCMALLHVDLCLCQQSLLFLVYPELIVIVVPRLPPAGISIQM